MEKILVTNYEWGAAVQPTLSDFQNLIPNIET